MLKETSQEAINNVFLGTFFLTIWHYDNSWQHKYVKCKQTTSKIYVHFLMGNKNFLKMINLQLIHIATTSEY